LAFGQSVLRRVLDPGDGFQIPQGGEPIPATN
jgi:hypothetical protein